MQTADIAFPWQKFHRIVDNKTGDILMESDDHEKCSHLADELNNRIRIDEYRDP